MTREIFVVDDNPDFQFIFFKLLKQLNAPYSVKFFENAKACHKHMKVLQVKQAAMPALLILDLNMPEMNGLQLLQMLKNPAANSDAPDVPVVIMSGYISEQQIQQCYQAGANAVVQKPLDLKHLQATVQSMCRFWLERDENHSVSNHAI